LTLVGIYKHHLFVVILPDNLCDNGLIITLFPEDSTFSRIQSLMELQSQTTTKDDRGSWGGNYDDVTELYKDDDHWMCDSWSDSSDEDEDQQWPASK
jgi:hypothetical protein